MFNTFIGDYLFVADIGQCLLLMTIVLFAGIVRGCIGFGFSAIVVASTSFWLPAVAVVNLVVLLEIAASVSMTTSVKDDVKPSILLPLSAGALATTFVGTWLLATLSSVQFQWIIGSYMLIIALLTLSRFEFKGEVSTPRIVGIGMIAGFFNGLAAVGGIAAAWGLVGSKQSVQVIRATLSMFFLFVEVLFLIGAYWNGLISAEILTTAALSTIPLVLGTWIGGRLFKQYSDETLKRFVLITLIALSLWGLYQT